jgi:phage gp45-like
MSLDLFRFQLDETDDSGALQGLKGRGVAGEELANVHRVQPFGFHSNAPKQSHGIALALHGQRDLVVALGLESPEHRPKNRELGSTAIYDAHGNIVSLVQANMRIVHATAIRLEAGGATLVLSAGGVELQGGALKHNGKNIGEDHVHRDVQPGAGTSGIPV